MSENTIFDEIKNFFNFYSNSEKDLPCQNENNEPTKIDEDVPTIIFNSVYETFRNLALGINKMLDGDYQEISQQNENENTSLVRCKLYNSNNNNSNNSFDDVDPLYDN
jgi:hypothetical protein